MPVEAAADEFEVVFHAHYERMARTIARIIRDPARAEELAVEVFWKLWRNPLAHQENVPGWLQRTAIRLALDELRRRTRREKYERVLGWFAASPRPDEVHTANVEQQRVQSVLACMDWRPAELLVLRSEGQSYLEIARTLELNPASVGTLLARAQEAFRKEYLKRYGE